MRLLGRERYDAYQRWENRMREPILVEPAQYSSEEPAEGLHGRLVLRSIHSMAGAHEQAAVVKDPSKLVVWGFPRCPGW
jgi:hypothetical protein